MINSRRRVTQKAKLTDVLLVIPAYNEAEIIRSVLNEIIEENLQYQILVVDDGSTDETSIVSKMPGVIVTKAPFNLGVGGAMKIGFKYALLHGYPIVVQIDADGQHIPSFIPKLVEQLDQFDVAIGARFAGETSYKIKGPRRLAMWVLAKTLSHIADTELTDVTSGFKAMGPKAIQLFAKNYPAEYLGDTVEALVIAARAECSITQVPVAMRKRQGGVASHSPIRAALYLGRALMALGVALIRPRIVVKEVH